MGGLHYRVEVSEIDVAIMGTSFADVSVTLPIYRNGQVLKLITFVTGLSSSMEELKGIIAKKLPSYMCLSEIIHHW
jgi:hypothetical protein